MSIHPPSDRAHALCLRFRDEDPHSVLPSDAQERPNTTSPIPGQSGDVAGFGNSRLCRSLQAKTHARGAYETPRSQRHRSRLTQPRTKSSPKVPDFESSRSPTQTCTRDRQLLSRLALRLANSQVGNRLEARPQCSKVAYERSRIVVELVLANPLAHRAPDLLGFAGSV